VRIRRHLVLITVLAVIVAITAPSAPGQAPTPTVGIRLVDAPTSRSDDPRARQFIVDHVPPGTTISRRVEISNDTAETQPVQLYSGAGAISDGSFQFGDGRAVNDLTTWTTVDQASATLPSGGKTLSTVTIAVPADASPGERYAVVWAELAPAVPAGGGITTVNRVGVRIYLSVGPGGEPASDFTVTAFEARRDADGKPVVAATLRNSGGRALDPRGELTLTGGPGGLSAGPFEAKLGTTLGIGQTEPVVVMLDPAIPAGPWDARIVLRSGLLEREATAKITFPAAPASSSGPVAIRSGSGRSMLRLALVGVLVALLLGLFLLTFMRRRRSS
jgi:hypothetical protein